MKTFAFTLDLEADHAGPVRRYGIFRENTAEIDDILSQLTALGVKITVFAVGEIFERFPDIIRKFEEHNCEFEIHSYTHKVGDFDLKEEITKAKEAYFTYFKRQPRGYRAPQGKISREAIRLLEKEGFLYDSSLFPSYYPNPFRYLFCNRDIHYYNGSNVLEIPLTAITPFRLTLSLSYIKLLGISFYFKLFRLFGLPDFICFNTHLHDFIINETSHRKLPPFWKFIYNRNKYCGLDYCLRFLKHIREEKYEFCFLSQIYNTHQQKQE